MSRRSRAEADRKRVFELSIENQYLRRILNDPGKLQPGLCHAIEMIKDNAVQLNKIGIPAEYQLPLHNIVAALEIRMLEERCKAVESGEVV